MLKLALFLIAFALIIWWGYQYNSDLPQRARESVRNNNFFKRFKRQSLARQFQEWVTLGSLYEQHPLFQGMPADKQVAFATWLKELDEASFKTLFAQTQKFSKDAQLNLQWLLNEESSADAELTEGVAASVVAYLVAYWEANELQERAAAFGRYEAWERNPTGRRNRAMTQALYNQLSERRDVQPLPADLTLASSRKRLDHMVAAIKNVAERDAGAVYVAIEEIQLENKSPSLRTRVTQFGQRFRRQSTAESAVVATTQQVETVTKPKGRKPAATPASEPAAAATAAA